MTSRTVRSCIGVLLAGLLVAPVSAVASPAARARPLRALGPGTIGQWTSPTNVGVTGIHAALLHTGKVLLYSYPEDSPGSNAALYDPVTGAVTPVDVPFARDIFCSGLTILPDGRVFVTGGMDDTQPPDVFAGIRATTIFDPVTETWSSGPLMAKARWYPTPVELADGTVLTLSGLDQNGENVQRVVESYDPASNSWTTLPKSARIQTDLFPRMVVLPGGKAFRAGADQDTRSFNPATNTWSLVGEMNFGYRGDGGVVLLPGLHQVLTAGARATTPPEPPS